MVRKNNNDCVVHYFQEQGKNIMLAAGDSALLPLNNYSLVIAIIFRNCATPGADTAANF